MKEFRYSIYLLYEIARLMDTDCSSLDMVEYKVDFLNALCKLPKEQQKIIRQYLKSDTLLEDPFDEEVRQLAFKMMARILNGD